ncbi:unnamed protein product [Mytilus coruscus]|uniref:Uncharacterized protein n=1 Tax=Mytilus coruscus TaxID=42192 RepID=A0A6J8DZF2_MYTCO|nr:unnamed protein product [Mytilus coruscus]
MQLKKLLPQAQGFNTSDACSDTMNHKHMQASIDSNCEISESQSFSRPRAHYSKGVNSISGVSHEIEYEISMGGSAISDENNNDSHSKSQPSHDKEFSLFTEGAPGSTDPIKWNNFLHKLTAKLKINCSEETEVDSVRTSYLPSRLNPGNSDKATHLKLPLEGTAIEVFKNVEKEAMSGRLKNRSVRLRDDKAFMVSKKDFTEFCSPPRLDDNIEEGLSSTMGNKKKARTLLRSVPYGSLIASYIDVAESEYDRVEACSALIVKNGLDFVSLPAFTGVKETVVPRVGTKRSSILEEVNSLLEKRAIEPVPKNAENQGYYSTIFMVPKRQGGLGPILNLKPLNKFVKPHHFKMETLRSILKTLQKVSPLQHFGEKVSIPSFAVWSTIGSKDFHKSDGSSRCISAKTNDSHFYVSGRLDVKKQQQSKGDKTITVHSGIIKKSGFDNQCGKILFKSDSNNRISRRSDHLKGLVFPSQERFKNISQMIQIFLHSQTVEARVMLRLLGLMASCIDLVPWARLHMRPLQLYLLAWWRPALHSLNHLIPLYQPLQEHLFWWINRRNFFRGVLLEQESAQVTLVTDASQSGWGAHINNYQLAGICIGHLSTK